MAIQKYNPDGTPVIDPMTLPSGVSANQLQNPIQPVAQQGAAAMARPFVQNPGPTPGATTATPDNGFMGNVNAFANRLSNLDQAGVNPAYVNKGAPVTTPVSDQLENLGGSIMSGLKFVGETGVNAFNSPTNPPIVAPTKPVATAPIGNQNEYGTGQLSNNNPFAPQMPTGNISKAANLLPTTTDNLSPDFKQFLPNQINVAQQAQQAKDFGGTIDLAKFNNQLNNNIGENGDRNSNLEGQIAGLQNFLTQSNAQAKLLSDKAGSGNLTIPQMFANTMMLNHAKAQANQVQGALNGILQQRIGTNDSARNSLQQTGLSATNAQATNAADYSQSLGKNMFNDATQKDISNNSTSNDVAKSAFGFANDPNAIKTQLDNAKTLALNKTKNKTIKDLADDPTGESKATQEDYRQMQIMSDKGNGVQTVSVSPNDTTIVDGNGQLMTLKGQIRTTTGLNGNVINSTPIGPDKQSEAYIGLLNNKKNELMLKGNLGDSDQKQVALLDRQIAKETATQQAKQILANPQIATGLNPDKFAMDILKKK